MKTLVAFVALTITRGVFAQEVQLDKKDLMEMVVPAAVESTCTKSFVACLELSVSNCKAEVEQAGAGPCATQIPDKVTDMKAITEISRNFAGCVAKEVVNHHSPALRKNANTAACQSLMK